MNEQQIKDRFDVIFEELKDYDIAIRINLNKISKNLNSIILSDYKKDLDNIQKQCYILHHTAMIFEEDVKPLFKEISELAPKAEILLSAETLEVIASNIKKFAEALKNNSHYLREVSEKAREITHFITELLIEEA